MATQIQQSASAATTQSQPPLMMTASAQATANKQTQVAYTKIILGLAKAELFLGCVCIALGFVIYAHILHTGIGPSVFEGIWCGFWIVLAGSLAILTETTNAARCLMNAHMVFSIIGAFFAATLFSIGVVFSIFSPRGYRLFLFVVMDISAFAAMILLITSAAYTSCLICNFCCQQQQLTSGQVVYVPQPVPAGGIVNHPGYSALEFQPMAPVTAQVGHNQPAPDQTQLLDTNLSQHQEAAITDNQQGSLSEPPNLPSAYEVSLTH